MNVREGAECPRCAMDRLRGWSELSDEEQEVARRLPASADYSADERRATHRWCINCWYEETKGASFDA